jgi:putative ABC transport system substrate-binding protein
MRSYAVLCTMLAYLAGSSPALAQNPTQSTPVIGWLTPSTAQSLPLKLLRDSLAKQGLVDGKDIRLDIRVAEGRPERLPELAAEMVRDGVSVILASGEQAARAAQSVTKTLPIVTGGDDMVGAGIVANLSRPGGNTTGVSILATELDAKKLEVLKELLPTSKRIGVLDDPATSGPLRSQRIAEFARQLGLELQTIAARGPDDLEPAFNAFQAGGAQGVNIVASAMFTGLRPRLGELSLKYKVPAICQWREMVEAGCFASYGVTFVEFYALYAQQIAKILKGAKPGDLPVIQPTKFELVINLKVAKALGLNIPQSALQKADEVIE